MSVYVFIQTSETIEPSIEDFKNWATQALNFMQQPLDTGCSIVIVNTKEMTHYNESFRHKKGPTNVLSFPFEGPLTDEDKSIGDIIICSDLVKIEAAEQKKSVLSYYAHMTVHGILHCLGYDHINKKDATIMEKKELDILKILGFNEIEGPDTDG